ncbi:MAG: hypothetical protein V2A67_02650 [Bacteroidota bacterium]
MRKLLIILSLSILPLTGNCQDISGLYVNGFDDILGNATLEDSLCDYIKECRFNQVLLYSLNNINWQLKKVRTQLRSLIGRFRNECGVEKVGAIGENLDMFLDHVHPYNLSSSTSVDQRFNIYDLEFEFWSDKAITDYYCDAYLRNAGYACTQEGAFSYVTYMLKRLTSLKKDLPDLETEIYIGWVKPELAVQLPALVDRIMPAVYISALPNGTIDLYNPSDQRLRLQYLAAGGPFKLLPIFNGDRTSSDPDLYPWLIKGHTVCEPWLNYLAGFNAETNQDIIKNVHLEGYQWFTYQGMPPVPYLLKIPGPVKGSPNPEVNCIQKYSIPVPIDADKITWMLASVGIHTYSAPNENSIDVMFRAPGKDTLFIQTFSCGAKSKQVVFPIEVMDTGMDVGITTTKDWRQETRAWGRQDGIVVQIGQPLAHEGVLALIDASGRCLYRKVLPPGYSGEEVLGMGNGLLLVSVISGNERFTAKVIR